MAILLLADHDNATLSDQTAKALTAAARIGSDVHVLVAGSGAKAAADAAARLSGVSKVLLADDASLANNLAEPLAALIVSLAGGYDAIVSAATSVGKNVLPRVAALLDVAQVSEIIEVVSADTFKRPIYAGNAIQTVQSTDARKVITVRTASFAAAGESGNASVETIPAAIERLFGGSRALLLADCCYSGYLGETIARQTGRVAFAALTSSLASELSTGNWTFTEALLAGLQGQAYADADGSRFITLQEMATQIAENMAFAEEQVATFSISGDRQARRWTSSDCAKAPAARPSASAAVAQPQTACSRAFSRRCGRRASLRSISASATAPPAPRRR